MVKIIEKKTFTTTCSQCQSKLEFTWDDVREEVDTDYLGDSERVNRITCPACSKALAVRVGK